MNTTAPVPALRSIDDAPDIVARYDRQLRHVYVNRAIERFTGLSAASFLGKSNDELGLGGQVPPEWTAALQRAFEGHESTIWFHLETPEGMRYFESRVAPERDERGAVQTVIAVTRDVSKAFSEQRFLSEASVLLGSSLDSEQILGSLANLAVPALGDLCAIHTVSPAGELRLVGMAHRDPDAAAAIATVEGEHLAFLDAGVLAGVLAGGPAVLVAEISLAHLERVARSPEQLAALKAARFTSAMVVPLEARGSRFGAITLLTASSGRRYGASDLAIAEDLARRAGLASDNARLFEEERRTRRAAERAADRTLRLQVLTAQLAEVTDVAQAAQVIAAEVRAALGAQASLVYLVASGGEMLTLAASLGVEDSALEPCVEIALSSAAPLCDAVRAGTPVLLGSPAERGCAYPPIGDALAGGFRAWAAIPLCTAGRTVGALALCFGEERTFDADARSLMATLTTLCAQALERARLVEGERRALAMAENRGRALLESEERLRVALSAGGVGTWRLDLESRIEIADPSMNIILGLPAVETRDPPGTFLNRVHSDDRQRIREAIRALVEKQQVFDQELRIVRPDGSLRWLRDRGELWRDPSGKAVMATGAATDITELKDAQDRFREESRIKETLYRLGALFARELDHKRLAQLITDEATALVGARFGAFFFTSPTEQGGEFLLHTLSGADQEKFANFPAPRATPIFGPTFAGERVVRFHDVRLDPRFGKWGPQPKGHPPVASFLAVPVRAPTGQVVGGLFFGHPEAGKFTEAHEEIVIGIAGHAAGALENARLYRTVQQREEQLAVSYEAAKSADRRKDEFLAMLGHELRNPLAPITTAIQLLKLKETGGVGVKEREVIERQVVHLTRLIDDLLDVSRVTRGKIELKKQRVELSGVLARAVEMASPLFERHSHGLQIDVAHQGLAVDGDPVRLAQIFQNLLTNAAKYTPPRGSILLQARRVGDQCVITVRDNGMGISPEVLPRVFDLFVQAAQSLDRAEGGLGIGLSLVRRLAEAHGGTVVAKSEGPGKGSEFIVSLPVSSAPAQSAAQGATPAPLTPVPASASSGLRVLVVDDNVDAGETLSDFISSLGHEVKYAHDGPSALAAVERFTPQIAILDIGLPVMDGYELGARLRERFGGAVQLIALTGYGQESDRQKTARGGFAHHLVKPVPLAKLEALLVPAKG